jgi:hypothetical protein
VPPRRRATAAVGPLWQRLPRPPRRADSELAAGHRQRCPGARRPRRAAVGALLGQKRCRRPARGRPPPRGFPLRMARVSSKCDSFPVEVERDSDLVVNRHPGSLAEPPGDHAARRVEDGERARSATKVADEAPAPRLLEQPRWSQAQVVELALELGVAGDRMPERRGVLSGLDHSRKRRRPVRTPGENPPVGNMTVGSAYHALRRSEIGTAERVCRRARRQPCQNHTASEGP